MKTSSLLLSVLVPVILVVISIILIFTFSTPDLPSKNISSPTLGPENASIKVVEYSEFQCPYCSAVVGNNPKVINQLKMSNPEWEAPVPRLKELAKEGKIQFVFKHFPMPYHSNAKLAAEASMAAHAQGKFWEYHDEVFKFQGNFDKEDLVGLAEDIGLNVSKFKKELNGHVYREAVERDMTEGKDRGVSATPTFFINGEKIEGAKSYTVFGNKIE